MRSLKIRSKSTLVKLPSPGFVYTVCDDNKFTMLFLTFLHLKRDLKQVVGMVIINFVNISDSEAHFHQFMLLIISFFEILKFSDYSSYLDQMAM